MSKKPQTKDIPGPRVGLGGGGFSTPAEPDPKPEEKPEEDKKA
jgi:hypothetical protein